MGFRGPFPGHLSRVPWKQGLIELPVVPVLMWKELSQVVGVPDSPGLGRAEVHGIRFPPIP